MMPAAAAGSLMKLSLEAGPLSPQMPLPLEIQSISPSGLAVLTSASPPAGFDRRVFGAANQEGEPLTFVLEKDGRSVTLHASLVWAEVSNEQPTGDRLELIVDTGDQPGWGELQAPRSQE
jgi:hypothetical protein